MSASRPAGAGHRRLAALLGAAFVGVLLCIALGSGGVAAQDGRASAPPGPGEVTATAAPGTPDVAIDAGDPRSDGRGPGLVGEPLLVLVGIVFVGVTTVVVTAALARATGRA